MVLLNNGLGLRNANMEKLDALFENLCSDADEEKSKSNFQTADKLYMKAFRIMSWEIKALQKRLAAQQQTSTQSSK